MKSLAQSAHEGGTCDSSIRSRGNFWGYVVNRKDVEFVPCPVHYCCTPRSTRCESYNTCAVGRTGTLCGQCLKGHTLNLVSHDCVKSDECSTSAQNIVFFVMIFSLSNVFMLVLLYLEEVGLSLKRLVTGYLVQRVTYMCNRNVLDSSYACCKYILR